MTEQSDDAEVRKKERADDAHERERAVLFGNETFFLGMLQAVSGASLFAALAQSATPEKLGGRFLPPSFLTLLGLGLAAAVVAAYWKHQYKMWDVKAAVSKSKNRLDEAEVRRGRARFYLSAMRFAMLVAVLSILFALVLLVAAAWPRALCPVAAP